MSDNVYPFAIDGANYTVTVSAGISSLSTTVHASNVDASTEANGTFKTAAKYTFQDDLDIGGDLSVTGAIGASSTIEASGNITSATALITDDLVVIDDVYVLSGTGSPEGVVSAPVGSLYLNKTGGACTTHYSKESGVGNTGWVAMVSARVPVTTQVGTYTISATDNIVICDGTFTATLPTAVGISGKSYTVKNISAGTITLDGDGSETIDGAATQSLSQWDVYSVVSDGTNWIII